MKLRMLALTGILGVSTALAQSPAALTDAEVDAAIGAAKQQRFQSLFIEAHGRFLADFSVLLQGPIGRTMDFARDAFESYKPLTASGVPAEIKAREVTVTVITHDEAHAGIKHVVIMPLGATSRDAAIQPLAPRPRRFSDGVAGRDTYPRTWKPGLGWQPSGLPRFCRFAEDRLPAGDIQIVVVTDTGEARYTVKAQERDRMR